MGVPVYINDVSGSIRTVTSWYLDANLDLGINRHGGQREILEGLSHLMNELYRLIDDCSLSKH